MKHKKQWKCLLLILIVLISSLGGRPATQVQAKKKIIDSMEIKVTPSRRTLYLDQEDQSLLSVSFYSYNQSEFSSEDYQKEWEKIQKDLIWSTSDVSILGFVKNYQYDEHGQCIPEISDVLKYQDWMVPRMIGLKKGTATLTISSRKYKISASCKITVKNAELTCEDEVYYTGNTYQFVMKGNAKAVQYTSSDPKTASVNAKTGKVTAKQPGEIVITCTADNGTSYTKKMKIQKAGLNYSNITSYYFTGYQKGCYSTFPIVAKGIQVKKWSSSDPKVVKVKKKGSVGQLEIHGTGKCTVTCTDQSGKTYSCKVTIVGGRPWSGLSHGYLPDINVVKKHGYYKDINSVQDYGKIVFYLVDYNQSINLKNGHKKMSLKQAEEQARQILQGRYPGKEIQYCGGGDLIQFTSGNQLARIWYGCCYVE